MWHTLSVFYSHVPYKSLQPSALHLYILPLTSRDWLFCFEKQFTFPTSIIIWFSHWHTLLFMPLKSTFTVYNHFSTFPIPTVSLPDSQLCIFCHVPIVSLTIHTYHIPSSYMARPKTSTMETTFRHHSFTWIGSFTILHNILIHSFYPALIFHS